MKLRIICIFLVAFALTSSLFAQISGRISGNVTDSSGAAIPGATVELFVAGGKSAVLNSSTNGEGFFVLAGLRSETYDLSISSQGFRKELIRNLKVDTSSDLTLKTVKLEISTQTETVEVSAEAATVQTGSAEISNVVTNTQLRLLPSLNRSPLALLQTQAGVTSNARSSTTINGLRPSFSNVTFDGINIQDNFIRTNSLDFQPNLLLLDQVAEATLVTSNSNPALGNGAAQINISSPSGTNQYHGSLLWFNRNNIVSANTWFNNRSGVARPFLNQNQFGGSIGGPIKKDKLFFYANYEGLRLRQQSATTRTVLRDAARRGLFTYRDSGGTLRQVNVLNAAGVAADPRTQQLIAAVPGAEVINRDDIGDGLNTGGYGFNIRNNRTRDNVLGKLDYNLSTKHAFAATYTWNRDIVDRPDQSINFLTVPTVQNDSTIKLLSLAHRWSPTATFTNELRGGLNLAPAPFTNSQEFGNAIFAPPLISNPVNTFRRQGRTTNTYSAQNNSTLIKGRHTLQFGYQSQWIRVASYNDAGITPTYTLALSSANTANIAPSLPGISAADLANANALLALQAGFVSQVTQTFNVRDSKSGFLPNESNARNLTSDNYALYGQDKWKLSPRFTLTAGLRWDYYTPVNETNSLALLPVLTGSQNAVQAFLNPNNSLDFAGKSVGRPFYKKDLNNFAPNIGLAYDIFGDGKTSFRAGYSVNFANDEFIVSVNNSVVTNAGLSQDIIRTNLVDRASTPPPVTSPTFKVPRTYAENYALNTQTAYGLPDPTLVTPYVQQWSAGIQREVWRGIIEVRYVGNRATKQFRAFDFNQVRIDVPGYREDFLRARQNGELARAATGTFNPVYNASIPGSVQLPFFDQLAPAQLTSAANRGIIERGEIGELANTLQINRANGPFNFYRNPNGLGLNLLTNYSNANYHGLQIDYTRRYARGFYFQANYVWSKNLSDSSGDVQTRFEPFLDINNGALEYSRTAFDLRQQFKLNSAWDLPFGKGHRLAGGGVVNQIIGGWTLSTNITVNSGSPFSILSGRGTLNRAARSASNTANTNQTYGQLQDLMELRVTGDGPFLFAPGVIASDTRGTNLEGRATYAGQAFFNPGPGELGSLGRRIFSGPIFKNADLALQKRTIIRENHSLDLRAEVFNATNTPSFSTGTSATNLDWNINNTNFGRIVTLQSGRRVVQFSLYYRF